MCITFKTTNFVALMKISQITTILTVAIIGFSSCKSSFEEVRASNDPVRILAEANKLFEAENYIKAQTLYDLVIPFYRGKEEAEDIFYKYSYTYYHTKQYILASHYFSNYAKTFYNSPHKEEASFLAAYSNYLMSPNHKLDQTPTADAIEQLQVFINTYPNSPRVDECNDLMDEMRAKLEEKAYETGKLYYQLGNFQSAAVSFENVLKDFPESNKKEDIRFFIVESNYRLARNSIYEKMKLRLEKTIELADKFENKYPDSDRLSDIAEIKSFCNNEIKDSSNDRYQKSSSRHRS